MGTSCEIYTATLQGCSESIVCVEEEVHDGAASVDDVIVAVPLILARAVAAGVLPCSPA